MSLPSSDGRFLFHLYDLRDFAPSLDRFMPDLSDDEKKRAEKMTLEARRRQFVLARALLRRALSLETGWPPSGIEIETDGFGKLFATDPHCPAFSLSHCEDKLLIGLDRERKPFGVDLQKDDPSIDFALLSRNLYSREERDSLSRAAESERRRLSLLFWCRHEARFKAGLPSDFAGPPSDVYLGEIDGYFFAISYSATDSGSRLSGSIRF